MKEIIMAIIVLFGGLVLSISTYNDSRSASKLERQGLEVVSEVLNEYTEKTKNGVVYAYNISPSFKTQNGMVYTCHGEVKQEIIDQLRVIPTIKIRYLMNDPQTCMIDGAENKMSWLILIVGIVMVLGSVAYMYNRSSIYK